MKDKTTPVPSEEQLMQNIAQLLPGAVPTGDEAVSIEASLEDPSGDEGPLSDEEVLAILDQQEALARGFVQDEISHRARKANEYYLATPSGDFMPPGIPGRSNYVDSSVADAINWMLPPLMDIFASTEDIVEFCPRSAMHADAADQTTSMVNHVWKVQNDGFQITRTWIHDALMAPAGIVKVYWEENQTKKTQLFRGLTDLEFALLSQDPANVVVKHRQYADPGFERQQLAQQLIAGASGQLPPGMQPPMPMAAPIPGPAPQGNQQVPQQMQAMAAQQPGMPVQPPSPRAQTLHDVIVVNVVGHGGGQVKIVNVPLEEFYVAPTSRTIDEGYSAHVVRKTVSDLRALGYDEELLESIDSESFDPAMSETALARTKLQGSYSQNDWAYGNQDESQRTVLLVEAYLKMDYRQTGIAEWRKISRVGNVILENAPTDGPPFILLVSNPLPHLLFGQSVAEQAMNAQLNNTQTMRNMIDNIGLSANSQFLALDDGSVNLDDLLDSRPGGIVRVKNLNSVTPLQTTSGDVGSAIQLMQLLDTAKQERTGVMKLTQGSDADILNATASGNAAMTDRASQRIKLMAREFAENGFKPLALRIQKLLAQYQDQFLTIRINGKWTDCDPTAANNQYDINCTVGLGTGDKTKQIQSLQAILGMQQQAMPAGMSNPELIHNTLEKITKALGQHSPQEFFCAPPPPQPPAPPPQDPRILEIQAQGQKDLATLQAKAQLDDVRAKYDAEVAQTKANLDYQRQVAELKMKNDLAREQMYAELALKREMAQLNAGISPMDETAAFNSAYSTTVKVIEQDDLLNAIIQSPEPFGGTPDMNQ